MITVDILDSRVNDFLNRALKGQSVSGDSNILIASSSRLGFYTQHEYELAIIIQDNLYCVDDRSFAKNIVHIDAEDSEAPNGLGGAVLRELMMFVRSPLFSCHQSWYESLVTFFQPIYSLNDEALLGYELLSRLDLTNRLLSPDIALHWLAPIEDAMIFEKLLLNVEKISDISQTSLFLNLECASLCKNEAFEIIRRAVEVHNKKRPDLDIVIELTERQLDRSYSLSGVLDKNISILIDLGVSFAIDDFGVESSNYDRVRRFSNYINYVKIDKEHFWDILKSGSEVSITDKIIELINSLHVEGVIIEGIEDKDQLLTVKGISEKTIPIIVSAQGYYLGRPTPHPFTQLTTKKIAS